MRERTRLDTILTSHQALEEELTFNVDLAEIAEAESDEAVLVEAETALADVRKRVLKVQLETLLSGEADGNSSYLEVHAGAGGTESQDWAEMLLRMYIRWAEAHYYQVEWIEESPGEEAGIKSATIRIVGRQRLRVAKERKRRSPSCTDFSVRCQRPATHKFRQRRCVSSGR